MNTYTAEGLRTAGYAVLRGDPDWIESVIQKAIETDTGIYHAAWLVSDKPDEQCYCTPCMRERGDLR